MVPDFTIPISYTTDTGVDITCTIKFFNGEINYRETDTRAVDFLRSQDWTGIGQRIYETALAEEAEDSAGRTAAGEADFSPWIRAAQQLIVDLVPSGDVDSCAGWWRV